MNDRDQIRWQIINRHLPISEHASALREELQRNSFQVLQIGGETLGVPTPGLVFTKDLIWNEP